MKPIYRALLSSLFLAIISIPFSSSAQTMALSAHLGYSAPQGDAFTDPATNEKQSSFGLGAGFDALYCLERFDNKIAVGITYDGNALFGKNSSDALDIGIYGLSLYGVKGLYRFLEPDKTFSPYASFGFGLSRFATPDVTLTDANGTETVINGESAFSLGLRPEVGLDIGGFLLSTAYFVPMKYDIDSNTGNFDGSAGVLSFSLGYRFYFDL